MASPPTEFTPLEQILEKPWDDRVTATFSGTCPVTGDSLSLPRTVLAERAAQEVMDTIPYTEDKMFGVLLARRSDGVVGLLKAFSGKLQGSFHHPGWVPPMLELAPSTLEDTTRVRLDELKTKLLGLVDCSLYRERASVRTLWSQRTEAFNRLQLELKAKRARRRLEGACPVELAAESRGESARKRAFKKERAAALEPLERLEAEVARLKGERRELSRALQAELHSRFDAELWKQLPWSLTSLFPSGPPTGTGECCAPKLLYFARSHDLEPLALAEFWWGDSTEARQRGEFYAPCEKRCGPLLGPLLSTAELETPVLHEDPYLVVVSKPSGLLTVAGRQAWNQDCLLGRLVPQWGPLYPVHRLDLETSGLVILARDSAVQGKMQKFFAERRVLKTYQALLRETPWPMAGRISEPIARGPDGRYSVSAEGRSAVTDFRVLEARSSRVELKPVTGRSHQLRVHCAQALGIPILGDPLYGKPDHHRLMLHAQGLEFLHPVEAKPIKIECEVPF